MDVAHGCSGVTYPYLTEGDLVKRHDRRPHFSTVKKVLSFFSPLEDKKDYIWLALYCMSLKS